MVIGKQGILTTEEARNLARQRLAEVLNGEDPSAKRRAARCGMTVSDICDWYLTEARAGRILGRNRRPIKASTLDGDEGRINVHIKPLIGAQPIRGIILVDVEKLQTKIASGRAVTGTKRRARSGQTKGGAGVASRTVSTLRSMLGHAKRFGLIQTNPALGVRVIAGNKKLRRLSREELGRLGAAMAMMEEQGEHPTGLATIRAMLVTGFRKMEVLGMHRAWIDVE